MSHRNSSTHFLAASLAVLTMLAASHARADLLGVTISGCTNSVFNNSVSADPGLCDPQAAGFDTTAVVVEPGIEFSIDDTRRVDFSGDTVSLIYNSSHGSSSPDLFVFTDLIWQDDPTATISGLELISSNLVDVTTTFSDHAIGLLVNSPLASATDTTVTYRIQKIPEPSTLVLFGCTLASTAFLRRRRAKC